MKATHANGFWALPSKNRPESLKRFFTAYWSTLASTSGMLLLSPGDYPKYYVEIIPKNWTWRVVESTCQGDKMRYLRTLPEYWKAEWIGWLNDDQVPVTEKWDLKTIEHLNGKNFVSGNDEWQPHRMVGALAFSRHFIDLIGGFYPIGFRHMYVDDILETIGQECGCWVKLKDVVVHHYHHLNKRAEHDSTYKNNEQFFADDRRQYLKWLATHYIHVKRRVLELQKQDL